MALFKNSHPVYTTGVIQVYVSHNAARLQNCPRSLDKVDTAGLLHSQSHHHLHHLNIQHKHMSPTHKLR